MSPEQVPGVGWRDLKLGGKIFAAIGAVLLLLALSISWTIRGSARSSATDGRCRAATGSAASCCSARSTT